VTESECSAFGIDRTPDTDHHGDMDHAWHDENLTQLAEAVTSVGLGLLPTTPDADDGTDAFVTVPDDKSIPVQVKRVALVSAGGLHQTLRQWGHPHHGKSALRVVVADRITADAREVLRDADWGWLDLRGHLHLKAPGLFVDAGLAPLRERRYRPEPFAGQVGIEVAASMLLQPYRALGVRQLATQLGRAPSSVSAAIKTLRRVNLVDDDGKPRSPDLFWELVSVWKPNYVDVKAAPEPGSGTVILEALRINIDDVTKIGWALSDTRAAAAYGAPIALRADQPPDFYVPDERVMRRAVHLLGPAAGRADRAATLRVGATMQVCIPREDPTKHEWNRTSEYWPLAQPLFVALDLAQDPGRGRDTLNEWTPPEPWCRVW
jgi:DNA-binding transcriptional ArsR family regulator